MRHKDQKRMLQYYWIKKDKMSQKTEHSHIDPFEYKQVNGSFVFDDSMNKPDRDKSK